MAASCGDRAAVDSALSSILFRSCSGVRCVVISNNSDSRAVSVVGRCRPLFGKQLG